MKRPQGRAVSVLRAVPAVAWAAGIWALSATPDPPGAGLGVLPHLDKAAHVGLFLVQAGLLRLAGLGAGASFVAASAWGAIDEWHQSYVPGRDPSLGDLAADAIGAVLGANLVEWIARLGGARR